ncbi:MAG TPA: Rieske 2Fe-2S domain-containing protein [Candidatus Binatia bacterium]|nr:Rieske 2Fe-2S domain-containing protein [Candidatus Binatia bacterium]
MATRKKNKGRAKLSFMDLICTGPGTPAGRYLRMFWHPVYRAEDIPPGTAKPIRIMGEDFTLYRGTAGAAHVIAFRCAHRGTQLSAGWVEGDCIRCMYHGWLYDGTGQCVEQPAEEESFAKKIRIRSYPTKEYLGLLFAYFGEGEAPPFPRYPHFEKEGVLEVLPVQVWPCNFFQRVDNNGDTLHVPFVHRGAYLSADIRSGLPTISKEESPWGTTAYATFPGGWTNVLQFVMPNAYTFRNPSPDPEIPWDDRFQWDVPLDDQQSLQFRLRLVPLTGEAARRYRERYAEMGAKENFSIRDAGQAVLAGKLKFEDLEKLTNDKISLIHAQDYVSQVGQGVIADRAQEHLGRSDVGVILFRKIWERELRAFAEGRPLKKWALPQTAGPDFVLSRVKKASANKR